MGEELTAMLASTRARWPNLRFAVQGAGQRRLLQYLKQDELDIVVALVPDEPEGSARHYWPEELAWVRGKTTTLEIVEGLRQADGGTVSVLGLAPWPRNPALLPRIGVQLQASSFFERLTAREQLQTFAMLYGVPARRADAMLGVVGLDDQAGTRTEKLSGGQAQRLSIACALVHDPEVLFLDEPGSAMSPTQCRCATWSPACRT